MEDPTLLLVDASNVIHRHARVQTERSYDGQLTGGINGSISELVSLWLEYNRPRVVVCWEGFHNWRRDAWAGYKAKREKTAAEKKVGDQIRAQAKALHGIYTLAGIDQRRPTSGEADDAIATLVEQSSPDDRVMVVSRDSDLAALVSDRVWIYRQPATEADEGITDVAKVREKWGVTPEMIPELKALAGDTSDGIPGVTRIGPVGARRLLTEFGDIDGIFEALASPHPWPDATEKVRKYIEAADRSEVDLYLRLTTLNRKAALESAALKPDVNQLAAKLESLGLDAHADDADTLMSIGVSSNACPEST